MLKYGILTSTPNGYNGPTVRAKTVLAYRANLIAGLHEGGVAAASGTESGAGGVFTRAEPLSVPLEWASTSADLAAWCHYEPMLHALFFQTAQAW